jgi:hypothetical protein
MPGLLIGLGSRTLASRALSRVPFRMPFNTTVTNVPALSVPVFWLAPAWSPATAWDRSSKARV